MSFLLQILKWEPDYYKKISDLPQHMPKSLQDHIKKVAKKDSAKVSSYFIYYTFIKSTQGSAKLLDTKIVTKKIQKYTIYMSYQSICQDDKEYINTI